MAKTKVNKDDRSTLYALGGSEIGFIAGLSNFKSPLDVYNRIINNVQEPENLAMSIGKYLEPLVVKKFEAETGYITAPTKDKRIYHKDYDFFVASVDRLYMINKTETGILECKTGKKSYENIPEFHYSQIIWYLGILQKNFGCWSFLNILNDDFSNKFIEFGSQEQDIFNSLIEVGLNFWFNHILKRIPPEPTSAQDIKKYIRKHSEGKILIAVPETYQVIKEIKKLKGQKKEIENNIEELENSLLPVINDSEAVTDDAGNILLTYKATKDTETFDTKSFKVDNPELYQKYLIPKPGSRRLLIK